MALRTRPDARRLVDAEPDGDELGEPGAGLVEHAERRVLRVDELGGGLGDPAQRIGEGLLRPDRHDRVEQPEHLLRTRELEPTGHRLRLRPTFSRLDP